MSPLDVAAVFAILLVAVIVGFLALASYNAVVTLRQQASKAWANIDVALKQRHDELPNLVNAVRGVMAFEQETLARVTRLRAAYTPSAPIPAQAATSEATSAAVRQLFAVVERYPQLTSAANVLDLQREIRRLEDVIAARRELYNDTTYRYNTRIRQFPTNVLAWVMGWSERAFFAAPPGDDAAPSVEVGADSSNP